MAEYDAYTTVNVGGLLTLGLNTASDFEVTDVGTPPDNPGILGDVTPDTFTAPTGLFGANVTYTYAGVVYDGDGSPVGFVGTTGPLGSLVYTTFVPAGTDPSLLTLTLLDDDTTVPESQWNIDDAAPVCFLSGTLIQTPDGPVAVEKLVIGQLVTTSDGRAVPVKWMGRQTLSSVFGMPEGRRPVRILAGALGDGLPRRDLRVTADHALVLDGALVAAGALVNGDTILRMTDAELGRFFTVHHIETENHEIVLAEGSAAETFVDNVTRKRFDNYDEFLALYGSQPDPIPESSMPRAMSARQTPLSVRARIAEAARALRPAAAA
ncbi:Hint domain-containing protein [Methylopila henanensis]|uniref:Hint domain-containing protein n=1 Tax=Methylopila henanensis TaxID=873516 RepID=A0ABW4K7Q2_9HYPH